MTADELTREEIERWLRLNAAREVFNIDPQQFDALLRAALAHIESRERLEKMRAAASQHAADSREPTAEEINASADCMFAKIDRAIERREREDAIEKFVAEQEPLGTEFAKVLHDNASDLYARDTPAANKYEQPARHELLEKSLAADKSMERLREAFPTQPTDELVGQLEKIAWADYKEDDPTTGEAFERNGRTIMEAAARIEADAREIERREAENAEFRAHTHVYWWNAKIVQERDAREAKIERLEAALREAREIIKELLPDNEATFHRSRDKYPYPRIVRARAALKTQEGA